ncbi:hypothetical protein WQE_43169 [Paraburkholderia hospita]|uniref:HTH cro/C1-type domain-containing protein n=2 Tax=Paraburkholderia hospita TaxID=169430 RepID=A0ABP2PAB0_9BURK|nr:hypothetical protein WQE_43169 [Paraburkholderia hospita]
MIRAMKTILGYLDAVKDQLNLRSDNAISKALGISRATVSRYRAGICVFDDEVCFTVARILDINPLEVIVAAHSARARDAQEKTRWASYWKDFSANFIVARASCRD